MTTNVLGKNLTPREVRGFSTYTRRKLARLRDLLKRFPGDATHLKCTGEKFPSKAAYKVSFELRVGGDRLFVYEDSHSLHEATDLAFDKLVAQLKHHVDRHAGHERRSRSTRRALKGAPTTEADAEPEPVRRTTRSPRQGVDVFREVKALLPALRAAVDREVRKRVLSGDVLPDQLSVDDVLDSVVIDLYERAESMPDGLSFAQWAEQRTQYYLRTMLRREQEVRAERVSLEGLARESEAQDRDAADGTPHPEHRSRVALPV